MSKIVQQGISHVFNNFLIYAINLIIFFSIAYFFIERKDTDSEPMYIGVTKIYFVTNRFFTPEQINFDLDHLINSKTPGSTLYDTGNQFISIPGDTLENVKSEYSDIKLKIENMNKMYIKDLLDRTEIYNRLLEESSKKGTQDTKFHLEITKDMIETLQQYIKKSVQSTLTEDPNANLNKDTIYAINFLTELIKSSENIIDDQFYTFKDLISQNLDSMTELTLLIDKINNVPNFKLLTILPLKTLEQPTPYQNFGNVPIFVTFIFISIFFSWIMSEIYIFIKKRKD